ncbi:hypothetical protein [Leptospira limi]|uniref:Lipoprotein n=1 Tax=Leptospira limi TaxID=2950023 RepID=A0ABT3LYL2_9LEPT|nr:hypothetical protein [Leptospira limi]MCW7462825.1 hypothetical protein [Leptospira limi]
MKLNTLTRILLLCHLFINCESSRDKCFEFRSETDWGGVCETLWKTSSVEKNEEIKKNAEGAILLACFLGNEQNKQCKKKRNWDVVDIF